jgi:Uma2 family endonuclease
MLFFAKRSRAVNRPSSQYEYMSLDDFEELLPDKPADEKWELIGGRVVRMMVGARWEHNRICQNVATAMMNDFRRRGSACRPFSETFWLKDRLLDLACFPDVMIRCGPLPPDATSLDDPVALVEVVSKGSAQRDRWEKWGLYRRLSSLQHHVLIERDDFAVDVFDRAEGSGFFERPRLGAPEDILQLPSIGFEMSLAEIYRDVLGT